MSSPPSRRRNGAWPIPRDRAPHGAAQLGKMRKSMSRYTRILGALALTFVLAQGAQAQERGVTFAVRGGGFNSLTDLNDAGTADFKKTGYSLGATAGIDLHRYVALRGDF